MAFGQAQSVVGTGFIPDVAETVVLKKAKRAARSDSPGGLYEIVLLVISFVLLMFGLLPAKPEQVWPVNPAGADTKESAAQQQTLN